MGLQAIAWGLRKVIWGLQEYTWGLLDIIWSPRGHWGYKEMLSGASEGKLQLRMKLWNIYNQIFTLVCQSSLFVDQPGPGPTWKEAIKPAKAIEISNFNSLNLLLKSAISIVLQRWILILLKSTISIVGIFVLHFLQNKAGCISNFSFKQACALNCKS